MVIECVVVAGRGRTRGADLARVDEVRAVVLVDDTFVGAVAFAAGAGATVRTVVTRAAAVVRPMRAEGGSDGVAGTTAARETVAAVTGCTVPLHASAEPVAVAANTAHVAAKAAVRCRCRCRVTSKASAASGAGWRVRAPLGPNG